MNKLRANEERLKDILIAKFLSLIDKSDDKNGCWNWKGDIHPISGYPRLLYGCFKYGNHYADRAHRFSYRFHSGKEIPEGLFVCHHCDNRKCVNPAHLFIGTHNDNMADMVRKRRTSHGLIHSKKMMDRDLRGAKNHSTKLCETDLNIIMKLRNEGKNNKEIAERFGVSSSAIWRIFAGCNWTHLTGIPYKRQSRGNF